MKHRQKSGRTSGSADVPIVVVTRRWVVPAGPDCTGCNENCGGRWHRIQPVVLPTRKPDQMPQPEHRLVAHKQWAKTNAGNTGHSVWIPSAHSYAPGTGGWPDHCGRPKSQQFPRASNRYNAQGLTTDVRATDPACPQSGACKAFNYDRREIVPARQGLPSGRSGSRRQP